MGSRDHEGVPARGREDVHDRDRRDRPRGSGSTAALPRRCDRTGSPACGQCRTRADILSVVPDVTVSIVAGGDGRLLEACLASLPARRPDDDAPDDRRRQRLTRAARRCPTAWSSSETTSGAGSAPTTTRVLARAEGRYALILNDDTVLDPEAIDRLKWFLDQNPALGAAGPRLRYPDGRVQPSAFRFPTPGARCADGAHASAGGAGTCRAASASGGRLDPRRRDDGPHGRVPRRGRPRRALLHVSARTSTCAGGMRDARVGDRLLPATPGSSITRARRTAAVPERRIVQHARSRGLYARKHHGAAAERFVQGLTATHVRRPGRPRRRPAGLRRGRRPPLPRPRACLARSRRRRRNRGAVSGRVLVTGGLGFIGSAFVRALAADGEPVLNVDLDTYAGDERRLAGVPPGLVETVRARRRRSPEVEDIVRAERPLARRPLRRRVARHPERGRRRRSSSTPTSPAPARCSTPRRPAGRAGSCTCPPTRSTAPAPPTRSGRTRSSQARGLRPAPTPARRRSPTTSARLVCRPGRRRRRPAHELHRPVAAPREGGAAVGHPGPARRAAAGVGRRRAGARLDVRRGRRLGACACWPSAGERGRVYNVGPEAEGVPNVEIARAVARAAGRDDGACLPEPLRPAPARPPLRRRDRPDHRARMAGGAVARGGGRRDGRLVSANEAWWSTLVPDAEALYAD